MESGGEYFSGVLTMALGGDSILDNDCWRDVRLSFSLDFTLGEDTCENFGQYFGECLTVRSLLVDLATPSLSSCKAEEVFGLDPVKFSDVVLRTAVLLLDGPLGEEGLVFAAGALFNLFARFGLVDALPSEVDDCVWRTLLLRTELRGVTGTFCWPTGRSSYSSSEGIA